MTIDDHIKLSMSNPIIYYDAKCLLCNGFIEALIKRDSKAIFKYCSLQDDKSLSVRQLHNMIDMITTVILLDQGVWYDQSDVSVRIAQYIDGPWHKATAIKLVPSSIRNWIYRRIANNRYQLFGQSDECIIPDESIKNRFL